MVVHSVAAAVFNNVVVHIMFGIYENFILKPRAQNLPLRTHGARWRTALLCESTAECGWWCRWL